MMQCCTQLHCSQGHEKQSCVSTVPPSGNSQNSPEIRASLEAPAAIVAPRAIAAELSTWDFAPADAAETSQHSPPELYTLHLALLI